MLIKQKISAILITYNEEKNIVAALKSLHFADEIIVVDAFSTDNTVTLISNFSNVQLIQNKFENFAQQRNFALSLAHYNWILFIDADEHLSDKLQTEILETINRPITKSAYYFKRIFMFKSNKLRFSGFQNDKIIRLFQKKHAHYNNAKIVHEKLIVQGQFGLLKNKLKHYSYCNFLDYKLKMEQYGKLKAIEENCKGTNPNFYHFYLRPIYQFTYLYLVRFGIFDGKKGLIICYLQAFSVYKRFQELKKIQNLRFPEL